MSSESDQTAFRRVLLKPSGELLGGGKMGLDPDVCASFAREICVIARKNFQIAIVIGGGNIFRGINAAQYHFDRNAADHIGMLGTIINGLALKQFIQAEGLPAETLSALPIPGVIQIFTAQLADDLLNQGAVVVLCGGTGLPYFSTDTAAALRALQIKADILMKGTKVNGIFDADPQKNPQAKFYPRISFDDYLSKNLKAMDNSAIALCRDHGLRINVFNMADGNLTKAFDGTHVGTLIS
jgi:uridylate kinase